MDLSKIKKYTTLDSNRINCNDIFISACTHHHESFSNEDDACSDMIGELASIADKRGMDELMEGVRRFANPYRTDIDVKKGIEAATKALTILASHYQDMIEYHADQNDLDYEVQA